MKYDILLKNATLVNRMTTKTVDVAISKGRIARIDGQIDGEATKEIDLSGKILMPGVIDDQVHFREPGLTHKANIASEAKAGVAGGVTSFMEMPNTKPAALTQELLQDKYDIAAKGSLANYSFYMGVSNDNLEEALKTDPATVCGLKIFMGSSTGNMLVDDPNTLDGIFSRAELLIATHCEDEDTVRNNIAAYIEKYGENVPAKYHPDIRSREACYMSSSYAVNLAKKYGTRLHVLHITTAEEPNLFDDPAHRSKKRVTSEACVHHLTFCDEDYEELGYLIKCNPAIKSSKDRDEVWKAVLDGRIDVIATDHAPHTWDEKQQGYAKAPSGLPLIQHSLPLMMDKVHDGVLTMEQLVDKMCHAPADLFHIIDRGYADEGAWADFAIVDLNANTEVTKEGLLYHCGWSPLEGRSLRGKVEQTIINGRLVFDNGVWDESEVGMRMTFSPDR